jgi:hypothetical protein
MDRSRTIRHLSGAVYHLAYLPRSAAGRIDEESGEILEFMPSELRSIALVNVLNPIASSRAKDRGCFGMDATKPVLLVPASLLINRAQAIGQSLV